jgi:acetoacetyl-CoA synthetase
MQKIIDRHGFADFRALHSWSIKNPADFWAEAWQDLGIVGTRGTTNLEGTTFQDSRWFPEASLNIVDTLLQGDPGAEVIVSLTEDKPRRSLTRAELREEVAACASALRSAGLRKGDRVAAWMPNVPETLIFALGALSIGAIVSTASPDFGPAAIIDRFGQIEPKIVLVASGYQYGGRKYSLLEKVDEVLKQLPSVSKVLIFGDSTTGESFEDFISAHRGQELLTESLPFDHPGFALFSSGTTGKPKCISHSAAGVLIKDLSEQGYHMDIRPDDRVLYSTTCGWMMWNWLVCVLGRGATILLVDGSPAYDSIDRLFQVASSEKISFLGVSAALIDSWRAAGLKPKDKFDLSNLRTIASTGSPLAVRGFKWVAHSVSKEVSVVSIAGGTDLCGCLVLGVPTEVIVPGQIQGPALGLDVVVLRSDGTVAEAGEDGELVCRTPFPTVPLGFWVDTDGSRMHDAYFARFEGIWAHGDHARMSGSGNFEIIGRLDATLNAKGVRIGTAEIYRVVNALPEIKTSMAVSQPDEIDTRIVLFVVTDQELDQELDQKIRSTLRSQASPRHVPALIVSAPDLPITRNGKLAELVVSDIVSGRSERDTSSLANPECLDWFRSWAAANSF